MYVISMKILKYITGCKWDGKRKPKEISSCHDSWSSSLTLIVAAVAACVQWMSSLDLCLVDGNRLAPYYIGLKHSWRIDGLLQGTANLSGRYYYERIQTQNIYFN